MTFPARHLLAFGSLLLGLLPLPAADSAAGTATVAFVLGYPPLDAPAPGQLDQELKLARATIDKRLAALQVAAKVTRQGDRIAVRIRDASPQTRAKVREALGATGRVEFCEVYPREDDSTSTTFPEGYEAMPLVHGGRRADETLGIKRPPALTARVFKEAHPMMYPDGSFAIVIKLNDLGRDQFADLTRRLAEARPTDWIPRRLAILVNGRVVVAPAILQPILHGEIAISGRFSKREALELCAWLSAPVLPSILTESME